MRRNRAVDGAVSMLAEPLEGRVLMSAALADFKHGPLNKIGEQLGSSWLDFHTRATQPRVIGQATHQGGCLLLVWGDDQRAEILAGPKLRDRFAEQMGAWLPVLDDDVETRRVEPGTQDRLGRSGLASGADDG